MLLNGEYLWIKEETAWSVIPPPVGTNPFDGDQRFF